VPVNTERTDRLSKIRRVQLAGRVGDRSGRSDGPSLFDLPKHNGGSITPPDLEQHSERSSTSAARSAARASA